jgi:hypothetical protein
MEFSVWATLGGLTGNIIRDNIFVSSTDKQQSVLLQNFIGPELHRGTFSGNYMLNVSQTPVMRKLKRDGQVHSEALSLQGWQESEKQATGNQYLYISDRKPVLFYNISDKEKSFNVGKK